MGTGYFGKPQFRPALRTHGKDINLPDQLKDHDEFQDDKGAIDNATEDAVVHTPPDPLWPSGICSVIVHQIVNLELQNMKGSNGKRKGREYEPAAEAGENKEEEHKKLPSGYCTILFNDELVSQICTRKSCLHTPWSVLESVEYSELSFFESPATSRTLRTDRFF